MASTKTRTASDSDSVVIFHARLAYRAGEVVGLCLYLVVILLMALIASAIVHGACESMLPDSPNFVQFLTLVPSAIFVWLWWNLVKFRMQWCIAVGGDELVLGKWPFRERVRVDDVELIRLKPYRETAPNNWLEFNVGRFRKRLELGDDTVGCALLLREKCRRAVFVDQHEREYLPAWTETPHETLGVLIHHHRGRLWRVALSAVAWGVVAVSVAVAVARRHPQEFHGAFWVQVFGWGASIAAICSLFQVATRWRHYRWLRRQVVQWKHATAAETK